jgi:hypothetical protein
METFEKENQIIRYLDKKYFIREKLFLTKYGNEHHWGFEIADDLPKIFSFDSEFCKNVLTQWAYNNDLNRDDLDKAWGCKKLKTQWTPEIAQDLQVHYGITSAEEQLTKMLVDELSREIDAQILSDLRDEIKNPNELLGVMKCLGYETSEAVYDPNTFMPRKYFISTKHHEMMSERQNNPFWREWLSRQK